MSGMSFRLKYLRSLSEGKSMLSRSSSVAMSLTVRATIGDDEKSLIGKTEGGTGSGSGKLIRWLNTERASR